MAAESFVRRLVYGQAVGDAIGDAGAVHRCHTKGIPLEFSGSTADFTDDTDQMILIMRTLTWTTADKLAKAFAQHLHKWIYHGFPETGDTSGTGYGVTTWRVVSHRLFLQDPIAVAHQYWLSTGSQVASNGALMRTSILGLMYNEEWIKTFARVTHADPRCIASCYAVCMAISELVQGTTELTVINDHSFEVAKRFLETCEEEADIGRAQCIHELRDAIYVSCLSKLRLSEPGKIGYTFKTLGAAFWALNYARDYRDGITQIVMAGGDMDTNAAVAGAVLGTKFESIPTSWMEHLAHREWLDHEIEVFINETKPYHPLHQVQRLS